MGLRHRSPMVFVGAAAVAVFCASLSLPGPNFLPSAASSSQQGGQRILRRSTATIQPRSSESEAQFLTLPDIETWKAKKLSEQLFSQEMVRADQIDGHMRAVASRLEGFNGRSAQYELVQHEACLVEFSDSLGRSLIKARGCNDMAEAALRRLEAKLERVLAGFSASEIAPEHKERNRLPIYTFGTIMVILCFLAFLSSMDAPLDRLPANLATTVSFATMSDDEVASIVAASLVGAV